MSDGRTPGLPTKTVGHPEWIGYLLCAIMFGGYFTIIGLILTGVLG